MYCIKGSVDCEVIHVYPYKFFRYWEHSFIVFCVSNLVRYEIIIDGIYNYVL